MALQTYFYGDDYPKEAETIGTNENASHKKNPCSLWHSLQTQAYDEGEDGNDPLCPRFITIIIDKSYLEDRRRAWLRCLPSTIQTQILSLEQ